MANAIPVHSKKQEKQPEQSEQKPAPVVEAPVAEKSTKGVPYKMASGTICVDH